MFEALYHELTLILLEKLPLPMAASFSEVQESFAGKVDQAMVMRWMLFAGALLFVFCLISVWRYLRSRNQAFIHSDWIAAPRAVRALLNNAMVQRSTFEMQFAESQGKRRPSLHCSPRYFEKDRLGLEAMGVKSVARRWTGREVTCYFKISIKDQPVYYTFTTKILDVEVRAMDVSLLWLSVPDKLQNRQKRAFLRITPPEEYLLGAAIWHGRHMPERENMNDLSKWSRPNMALLPGKACQFEITDISAGGVRLNIPRKEQLATGTEFNVSEHSILLVDLLDPDTSKRLRFWLLCRVQNLAPEYNLRSLEMGMQFLAWAIPKDGGPNIEWLRLTREHEVAPLGNWIVRRHLELFRAVPEDERPQ